MNMPGFTAETSLYKTNKNYRMVAGAEHAATQVLPQGIIANAICGFLGGLCAAGVGDYCDEICGDDDVCSVDCISGGANTCNDAVGSCTKGLEGLGL